jgi:repressor LexA
VAIAAVEVQVLSSALKKSRPSGRLFAFTVDGVRRSLYSESEHTFVTVNDLGGAKVLTARQQEIWNYLVEYVDRHGYPPTVREIGEQVGLASPSTVHAHLANLERAGLLRRDPTKPRALELIGRERPEAASARQAEEQRDVSRLPLLGEIAAGGPMLAEQNIEEYLAMPSSTKGDFLLRVKGESMIEAGILDGDLVIVQSAQDARNGEIVVALAGDDESTDEATVKTFYRESNRIRLQPENSALEPIYAQHVQIIGRVVGVFREL